MPTNWSDRRSPRGLTLVEVVTGIALLSSLLVIILSAFRAHSLQVRSAKEQMQAIRATDELLEGWFSGVGIPPAGQHAALSQHPDWLWRLVPGPPWNNPSLPGAAKVRLQIVAVEDARERVLTSVELLAPHKEAILP